MSTRAKHASVNPEVSSPKQMSPVRSGSPASPLTLLSQWPLAHPRLTVLIALLLTLVSLVGVTRLRKEDDVFVFLPQGDADVVAFQDVARRFGALRVALIGVEPPAGQELFSAPMLGRLGRLSTALKNQSGVDRVVSLSTMTDLDAQGGVGVEVKPLIPDPVPTDAATLQRLQRRALSLPQVRGNIVSADGKVALLLVFLADGANTRAVADEARRLTLAELPGSKVYFGGAPFAAQAIYDQTESDLGLLTPLSLAVFLVIVLLSFQDPLAVVLTVGTVGVATLAVTGTMGFLNEPFAAVTSTLPVILFASGSQYAIHVLGRYYLLRLQNSPLQSARGAVSIAGPPVTIAAANTAVGFLSFLIMNIRPMRVFGVAAAFGVFLAWLLALTVLPAVVTALPRPPQQPAQLKRLGLAMERIWELGQRRRWLIVGLSLLAALVFARFTTQVKVRMEPRAFFKPGSEPAQAQAFLDTRFGGGQFLMLEVEGDILHPDALREVRRLSAFAGSLPGVTQVQSVLDPLTLVSEAMGVGRALPAERKQVSNLLFFIDGEPSVRTLLTEKHGHALVHMRLQGEAAPILAALEGYIGQRWPFQLRPHSPDELAEEVSWALPPAQRAARLPAIRATVQRLSDAKGQPAPDAAASARTFAAALRDVLAGPDGQALSAEARAALGAGAPQDVAALRARLLALAPAPKEDDVTVLCDAVAERAQNLARSARQQQATVALLQAAGVDDRGADAAEAHPMVALLAAAVLSPVQGDPPIAPALHGRVAGEPVLDRGFSRAVDQNQWRSLGLAIIGVLVILLISLRSVSAAVLCVVPAALALAVVFGTLGFIGQPIDIGTSLVGSIVAGSGADFAMHYVWYLRRHPPKEVARTVGPVLLTTAMLLAAGMGVLIFGTSPPIRLFGLLAASGLLLSALLTFLLVPACTPRRRGPAGTVGDGPL